MRKILFAVTTLTIVWLCLGTRVLGAADTSYEQYLRGHNNAGSEAGSEVVIDTGGLTGGSWEFAVSQTGMYNMEVTYRARPGKANDIEFRLLLDGEPPYKNAEMFTLPRVWVNEAGENGRFRLDAAGNEIRPRQIELFQRQTRVITDALGQYSGSLLFFLDQGQHTLALVPQLEEAEILTVRFFQGEPVPSYEEYLAAEHTDGAEGFMKIYEAETASLKNTNLLFPTQDKSRESVSPSHYRLVRYNTVGRDTWNKAGQALTYNITVPRPGYYSLAFKAKQTGKRGMFSTRAVYVDGKVPFAELGNVRFRNDASWYVETPGMGGEPYKIYLEAGEHTVTFEAVLGGEAPVLREAEALVAEMNEWYRKIIVITGSNADSSRITIDLNRDFLLDQHVPGLMEGFASIAARLDECVRMTEEIYGRLGPPSAGGSAGTVMAELAQQLRVFVVDPDKIPTRLENFYGSISSMATWVLEMRAQPLEMDWFAVFSTDILGPSSADGFFRQLVYRLKMFAASFSDNYNAVGAGGEGIEVWISLQDLGSGTAASGRDQANVIKRMTDDLFTPKTGINVNVSLVNSSAVLVQAVLAGRGPDAALVVSKDTPVNLAMRGACVPLDGFEGFEELTSWFMPTAFVPYQFEGAVYALPETQSFDMLFYRKDVFSELGLTPPRTWEEFYYVVSVLQQNNLLAGIPESQRTFEALLCQRGTMLYEDGLLRTTFDTPEALAAFEQWTGLYAKYSLPLVFDFFNRFRSGEMPMAIVPYTQCNYLAAAAPELKGLWDFAPIPGSALPDGTLSRAETAQGSACVMIKKDSARYGDVFTFLSWWVSAEAQAQFGSELENIMGAAARYPTANVEAFGRLPWPRSQADALMAQWSEVVEMPQIPGSYYIGRNISFAFRSVVYSFANERETLYKYNKEINKEIARKRREFGLPTG
ncbi:MAG: extracellular solute-binding protein [Clostridiales bacterium]|nr:extracellular solute-binding protein [Clostridiales bacterium]